MFTVEAVGDYGNFTNLNYEDGDPYGSWLVDSEVEKFFRSRDEFDGKYTQEFAVSRTLH